MSLKAAVQDSFKRRGSQRERRKTMSTSTFLNPNEDEDMSVSAEVNLKRRGSARRRKNDQKYESAEFVRNENRKSFKKKSNNAAGKQQPYPKRKGSFRRFDRQEETDALE